MKYNGEVMKTFAKGHPGVDNQNKSQNIMFNLWAPRSDAHEADWSAGRDDTTMPWFAKCDYIEYYSWSGDDEFEFEWREDF